MMAASAKSKKVENLVSLLHSTKSIEVISALKKIPEQGNATLIKPLLRTYLAWPSDFTIQESVQKILGELKTQAAVPELISALGEEEFDDLRALIISVFWQAGIYPTDELDVLIKNAIRGDYMVTMEVLTVVENSDVFTDPDLVQQYMLDIDEYLDGNPDAEHSAVLDQLKVVLKGQYNL